MDKNKQPGFKLFKDDDEMPVFVSGGFWKVVVKLISQISKQHGMVTAADRRIFDILSKKLDDNEENPVWLESVAVNLKNQMGDIKSIKRQLAHQEHKLDPTQELRQSEAASRDFDPNRQPEYDRHRQMHTLEDGPITARRFKCSACDDWHYELRLYMGGHGSVEFDTSGNMLRMMGNVIDRILAVEERGKVN